MNESEACLSGCLSRRGQGASTGELSLGFVCTQSFKPFGDVSVCIAAGVDVARIALAGVDEGLVGRAAVRLQGGAGDERR